MLHSLHFDTPCLTRTCGDAAVIGNSAARRIARPGGKRAGGPGLNFSSGGDGALGGFGVGPRELLRRRLFGELSSIGDEDRRGEGDGVPGDPGRDGAHTICSGVVDLILFSFSCSSAVTDSGVRLILRSSGVCPPSLEFSLGLFADFRTSAAFPSVGKFGSALKGWKVPLGSRKHGVSGSGRVVPGSVLAFRNSPIGRIRIGVVGNASAYPPPVGGVGPGDGGAEPEVTELPLVAVGVFLTTCLVLQ